MRGLVPIAQPRTAAEVMALARAVAKRGALIAALHLPRQDRTLPPMPLTRSQKIVRAVCERYEVQRLDLMSDRRHKKLVLPRHVAAYLLKTLTPRSLPQIGKELGGRDHTTILHAVRKIEALRQTDAKLDEDLRLLAAPFVEPEAE